jgi:hypothetical protein
MVYVVPSYWACFGLYPSSCMWKTTSPIALYNIHHRQNPFKSISATLYRAIGLVLDFIHRLVCGRQKIPQRGPVIETSSF